MNANDLWKPVKIALRTRLKQSQETRELLWWIRDLRSRLSTEN
jgi:hypothetical protein